MGIEKSTKPSSESFEFKDAGRPSLDLHLPEEPRRSSLPPLLSLSEMIRRNQQLREWFPAGLPTADERWQAKTTQEFKL
jgi:hypothetical protein